MNPEPLIGKFGALPENLRGISKKNPPDKREIKSHENRELLKAPKPTPAPAALFPPST
jgi:hypothetical protein